MLLGVHAWVTGVAGAGRRLTVARTSLNVVWYADDIQKEKKRWRLIHISRRHPRWPVGGVGE